METYKALIPLTLLARFIFYLAYSLQKLYTNNVFMAYYIHVTQTTLYSVNKPTSVLEYN